MRSGSACPTQGTLPAGITSSGEYQRFVRSRIADLAELREVRTTRQGVFDGGGVGPEVIGRDLEFPLSGPVARLRNEQACSRLVSTTEGEIQHQLGVAPHGNKDVTVRRIIARLSRLLLLQTNSLISSH